jgi:hypothetical protein
MINFNSHISRSRAVRGALASIATLAMLPATAGAATTWFGSSLNHTPANSGSTCDSFGGASALSPCTHVGSDYPGFSGHAKSPVNGTIKTLKLTPAGPMTFTAEVVAVRNVSSDFRSGQAKVISRSRQITVQGPTQDQLDNGIYPIVSVHVNLHVSKGQELAINTTSNTAEYCSDGTPGQLIFDPILAPGGGFSNSTGVDDCLSLFQAVVKH